MTRRDDSSKKEIRFRKSLYSAVRSLDWLLPQTEEEVAASERQVEELDSSDCGDPFEALDREPGYSERPAAEVSPSPDYEQELRRAARLGTGKVAEEVEERMRRDREREERDDDN